MARSDHGKLRKHEPKIIDDGRRGDLGPVLVYISGSKVNAKCLNGHAEDHRGLCHVCGALLNFEKHNMFFGGA